MSKFSEINSLVFIHDDDGLEDSKTLSFLTQMNKVQTINYTDFGCEFPLGGKYKAHIFPVYPEKDSCFTKWEKKNNYIVDYLTKIFNYSLTKVTSRSPTSTAEQATGLEISPKP